jgi:hypothetical protein
MSSQAITQKLTNTIGPNTEEKTEKDKETNLIGENEEIKAVDWNVQDAPVSALDNHIFETTENITRMKSQHSDKMRENMRHLKFSIWNAQDNLNNIFKLNKKPSKLSFQQRDLTFREACDQYKAFLKIAVYKAIDDEKKINPRFVKGKRSRRNKDFRYAKVYVTDFKCERLSTNGTPVKVGWNEMQYGLLEYPINDITKRKNEIYDRLGIEKPFVEMQRYFRKIGYYLVDMTSVISRVEKPFIRVYNRNPNNLWYKSNRWHGLDVVPPPIAEKKDKDNKDNKDT